MPSIQDIRQQYPQYHDMSDSQLADALHQKFYSDMPKDQFYSKIGVNAVQPSVGKTVFDQALQGPTFGWADELTDRLGSAVAANATMPKNGSIQDFLNAYNAQLPQARQSTTQELNAEQQQHPFISFAAQLPGAYASGRGVAAALGPVARLGTVGKAVQNIATTEGLGALYGAGAGQEGGRGEGAIQGALLSTLVGRGLPLAISAADSAVGGVKNSIKGWLSSSPEELQNAVAAMKQTANNSYNAMKQAGATFTPQATQDIVSDVANEIASQGKLNNALHGKTLGVLSDMINEAKNGTLDLEGLDQYRQLFREVAQSDTDITGKMFGDGQRATSAIHAIDDAVNGLSPNDISNPQAIDALNEGREQWAQMNKFRDVANIVQKSQGDANALKRNLTNFANKGKNTVGWTPEELSALKDAAQNSTGEMLLKQLGKFGFDLGSAKTPGNTALPALTIGAGAVGHVASGAPAVDMATAGLVGGGTAARATQKAIASGKAQTLLDILQSRNNPQQVQALLKNAQNKNIPLLSALGIDKTPSLLTALLTQ